MTVAAKPSIASYIEDGVSVDFAAPFRFDSAANLIVDRIFPDGSTTPLTLGTDYTVTGGTTDAGGNVHRLAAGAGGTLRIRRHTARAQTMVYATGDRFPAKSHEGALDHDTMVDQEQDDALTDLASRAIQVLPGEAPPVLPKAGLRAGKLLGFDNLGAMTLVGVAIGGVGGGIYDVPLNAPGYYLRGAAGWVAATADQITATPAFPAIGVRQTRSVQAKSQEFVHAFDAIPASMHTKIKNRSPYTDDVSQFLQPMLDATIGAAGGYSEIYLPGGYYNLAAGLDTKYHSLRGDGLQSSYLFGLPGMTGNALLTMRGQSHLQSLWFEAVNAPVGVLAQYCGSALIDQCFIQNALIAGIAFDEIGNNNTGLVRQTVSRNNGRKITCGTGSNTAGALDTLTITGAVPTSPLIGLAGGIRPKYDMVKIPGYAPREIYTYSANQIVVYPPLPAVVNNVPITIMQGSGLEIRRNGDNSVIATHKSIFQNNAFAGIDCSSLYGVQSFGDVCEQNSYALAIGRRIAGPANGGGEQQVINWSVRDIYSETNFEGAVIYHGSSKQGFFENPVIDGFDPLSTIFVADQNTLRDLTFTLGGIQSNGRTVYLQNAGTNNTSFGNVYIFSSAAGTPSPEMVLPALSANARALMNAIHTPIRFRTTGMNGQYLKISSADTAVNGLPPPANGKAVALCAGDFAQYEAVMTSIGWVITGTGKITYTTG